MKTYFLRFSNDEEGTSFLQMLKVESAKVNKSMKDYIIEAVKQKIESDLHTSTSSAAEPEKKDMEVKKTE